MRLPPKEIITAIARCWRVEPDDLYQDVVLLILRSDGPDDPSKFDAWASVIARRHAIDLRRLAVTSKEVTADFQEWIVPEASERQDELQEAEKKAALIAAIRSLRPMDFEVLNEFYYHGKPVADIAIELGVPKGTVQRRLFVARGRLRNILEKLE